MVLNQMESVPQIFLSTTANPGRITNGTQVTATYAMAGVSYGDAARVAYAGDLTGVRAFAYVNAPDSVVVVFANGTGATQNLPLARVNIWVEKPEHAGNMVNVLSQHLWLTNTRLNAGRESKWPI